MQNETQKTGLGLLSGLAAIRPKMDNLWFNNQLVHINQMMTVSIVFATNTVD